MQQPDFSTQPRRPRRALLDDLLLGLAVLAVVVAAAGSWRAREQARAAESLLAGVRRELAQDDARIRALTPVAAATRPSPGPTPGRVIATLAAVLPRDVRLRQLSLDYTRGLDLAMRVEARTPAGWDRLLAALESTPELSDVQPGPELRESPLATTLSARWAGGVH